MDALSNVLKRRATGAIVIDNALESPPPPCPRCGGAGYLRYDVPVEDPRFGEIEMCDCTRHQLAEREKQRQAERAAHLLELSGLARRQDIRLDMGAMGPEQDELWHVVRAYAEDPTPPWLYLEGSPGTGKTTAAVALANHLLDNGQQVVFRLAKSLMDDIKATFGKDGEYEALADLLKSEDTVLVLDEVGRQHVTPWVQAEFFDLLNHRWFYRMRTVMTTNKPISVLDPALQSRVRDTQVSRRVLVRGGDQRQTPR